MTRTRPIVAIALTLLACAPAFASEPAAQPRRYADDFAPVVDNLFQKELNLHHPGLEAATTAWHLGERDAAIRALLDYYSTSRAFRALGRPAPTPSANRDSAADAILSGSFTLQGIEGLPPVLKSGHPPNPPPPAGKIKEDGPAAEIKNEKGSSPRLDWYYRGPNDDQEYAWLLNRHSFVHPLLDAWTTTGNPLYATRLNDLLYDWITSNPAPLFHTESSTWRVMEASRRLNDNWPHAFYGLQHSPAFTEDTRLAMLASIPVHARWLMQHHVSRGNHLNSEMLGLASAAIYWPEFRDAPQWLDYAIRTMRREFSRRTYPDGVHHELSNHYQLVVAEHAERMATRLRFARHSGHEEFTRIADPLWRTLALTARPDGNGPLNNDCDLEPNLPYLRTIPQSRPEGWLNSLREPCDTRDLTITPHGTTFFKWAGIIIMRNGWDQDSDWTFFDTGPLGSAHQHYDPLHLSIHTGGRDILVDSGRYTYRNGPWRRYFAGPAGHNVVRIEGTGAPILPRVSRKPVATEFESTAEYDRASAQVLYTTTSLLDFDTPAHRRTITYNRKEGGSWIVEDTLTSARSRRIEVLWHVAPGCHVTLDGPTATITDENGNPLLLLIAQSVPWKADVLDGQTSPEPQGWYSPAYNQKRPAPCLRYRATFPSHSTTFRWHIRKTSAKLSQP